MSYKHITPDQRNELSALQKTKSDQEKQIEVSLFVLEEKILFLRK